ncbi:hypothetical protein F3G64_36435, partial [Pseudomonas aeruginosa]
MQATMKPYVCKVCKKCFVFKENFKTHMRMHPSEKRYGCEVCEKRFTQICELKLHI